MNFWTGIPFVGMILVALAAWGVCAVSWIQMLQNANEGWIKLIFKPFWWWPGNAQKFLSPDGMRAHARLMKAMAVFFIALFCGMAWVLLMVGIQEA